MACNNISQETRKASVLVHDQHIDGDQFLYQTPLQAQQTQFAGGSQQLCELSALLIIDAISK